MFLTYAIINYRKKTTIKVFHIYNNLLKKRKRVIMRINIKRIIAGVMAAAILSSSTIMPSLALEEAYYFQYYQQETL